MNSMENMDTDVRGGRLKAKEKFKEKKKLPHSSSFTYFNVQRSLYI